MRKGDGADGQRAKVMGNFTTEGQSEEECGIPFRTLGIAVTTYINYQ